MFFDLIDDDTAQAPVLPGKCALVPGLDACLRSLIDAASLSGYLTGHEATYHILSAQYEATLVNKPSGECFLALLLPIDLSSVTLLSDHSRHASSTSTNRDRTSIGRVASRMAAIVPGTTLCEDVSESAHQLEG